MKRPRSTRSPRRTGGNRRQESPAVRTAAATTNLIALDKVNGEVTKFDLTFDRPVCVKDGATAVATDFVMTCNGQTTRQATSFVARAANVIRATMSDEPATSHSWIGTVGTAAGAIVAIAGPFGARVKTIALP